MELCPILFRMRAPAAGSARRLKKRKGGRGPGTGRVAAPVIDQARSPISAARAAAAVRSNCIPPARYRAKPAGGPSAKPREDAT